MSENDAIGMIAGNGIYPPIFARAARAAGVERLVAVCFHDETEPGIEDLVDSVDWMRVGQLSKMIKFFNKEGIHRAVMVGQIAPGNLFDLRPDMRTLMLLGRLKERNAESIFAGIAGELAKDGIELIAATTYLDDLLPAPGHVCGPRPDKRLEGEAAFGFRIAKETSRLDVGQTVVVRKGTVLAVEAFEGTNAAIMRGGELGHGKAVVVKVSKPDQDLRFDVPCIGPETIRVASEAGVKAVVIEAGSTLLLDKEQIETLANELGVTVYAYR
ncbi:MAG: LpxI family protein [Verrucomicrobiaceae bacterium]|nr:LpxI family protein [Verrucomicrobiaceae bacterium]